MAFPLLTIKLLVPRPLWQIQVYAVYIQVICWNCPWPHVTQKSWIFSTMNIFGDVLCVKSDGSLIIVSRNNCFPEIPPPFWRYTHNYARIKEAYDMPALRLTIHWPSCLLGVRDQSIECRPKMRIFNKPYINVGWYHILCIITHRVQSYFCVGGWSLAVWRAFGIAFLCFSHGDSILLLIFKRRCNKNIHA